MTNPSNAVTPATPSPSLFASPAPAPYPGWAKLALCTVLTVTALVGAPKAARGQAAPSAPAAASAGFATADLRPALDNVQNAITAAKIARWKVPSDLKANTQQDVESMQRDLSTTLPGLMSTVESAPSANGASALAPAFALFRNLDALYDVLLRVSETANVGAPAADATSLEAARAALESGRGKLGAWLLGAITAQDAQVAQAAAAAAVRPPPPPPPPTKIVVDDGPDNPKPRKKKAPPAPAPQ